MLGSGAVKQGFENPRDGLLRFIVWLVFLGVSVPQFIKGLASQFLKNDI
jgi:hypothetical protein